MMTHFHCVPLNQPGSHAAIRSYLSTKSLGELLQFNPDGATVERVYLALRNGKGVEILSALAPHAKGTKGVQYRFLPFAGDLPEGALPTVREIVRF